MRHNLSVIIPVKNGAPTLEKCLQSIKRQTEKDIEIIVLDSMSTDESVGIAEKYNCKVVKIADGTFNHGLTRNKGVAAANGDIVFFTVQDAYLADDNMLERMKLHFNRKDVMGVTGHQAVPHDKDKNPLLWFNRISKPIAQVKYFDDADLLKNATPSEKLAQLGWDNVVAMYRKNALMQLPFIKTEYAEDAFWCYEALLRNWKLVYDPSLLVYHYHHKTYGYSFKVAWANFYHFYSFFESRPALPNILFSTIKNTLRLVKNKQLSVLEKFRWVIYNIKAEVGNFNAVCTFLWQLRLNGANGLKKSYHKYCKSIPQGTQNVV
jgi:rhamnosyltransferase